MAELPRPLPPPSWRDRGAQVLQTFVALPRGVAVTLGALFLVVAAFVLAIAGGLRLPAGADGPPPELSMPRADRAGGDLRADGAAPTTTAAALRVHAAGAVARPGVVTVPAGARVADVIDAAGGPGAEADIDQVNLAAPVADGERVYVPRRGEVVAAAAATASASPPVIVDLNRATLVELETLPGVGPATAQAILDYRSQRGRFRSVNDLLNVRGIGPAKLEQIKPHARV